MATMLEKAARAAGDVAATMESDVRHLLSERAINDIARAVLLAVREPDDTMIGAYFARCDLGGDLMDDPDDERHPAHPAFTAMIDAILNEGSK